MSHFLTKKGLVTKMMPKRHAGVRVNATAVKGNVLVVDPEPEAPVFLVSRDTQFTVLPPGYEVRQADGDIVEPSGTFVVSAETCDPFHILMDVNTEFWASLPAKY